MGKNVSSILSDIHNKMIHTYIPSEGQQSQDEKQAKILSNFLRQLKVRANSRKEKATNISDLKEDIYDLILDNIVLPNNRTVGKLFQRTGKRQGAYFEDDFAAVISSIVNLANPKAKTTYKSFSLGSQVGTTGIDQLDKDAEELIQADTSEIAETVASEIQKAPSKFVMGKIDTYIKGDITTIEGSVEFPTGVLEALSNATFTDKSYKSSGWRDGKQISFGERVINLGNSNPYRAIMGSVESLGFSGQEAEYIYYGGKNIIEGKDSTPPPEKSEEVKKHIYHLRYLYELTGAGIIYKNYNKDFFSGAKFLVYNDPMSLDITVLATSSIIGNILSNDVVPSNPYGKISISTSKIKSLS